MSNTMKSKRRGSVAGRRLIALVGALLASVLLTHVGCGGEGSPNVGDIKNNPGSYLGKQVVVLGEVEKIYHPRVFSMNGDQLFTPTILVVTKTSIQDKIRDSSSLRVTAVVRMYNRDQLQSDINFTLPNEVADIVGQKYNGQPVLVASQVFVEKY